MRPLAVGCLSDLSELIIPRPALSLDVNSLGVSPRLGLELFRPVEWYRTDPSGWRSLIEYLNEKGWCLPAKAQALTEWPRIDTFFGRDGVYRVRQVINHVKLLVHNGNVSVKGYAALDVRKNRCGISVAGGVGERAWAGSCIHADNRVTKYSLCLN